MYIKLILVWFRQNKRKCEVNEAKQKKKEIKAKPSLHTKFMPA